MQSQAVSPAMWTSGGTVWLSRLVACRGISVHQTQPRRAVCHADLVCKDAWGEAQLHDIWNPRSHQTCVGCAGEECGVWVDMSADCKGRGSLHTQWCIFSPLLVAPNSSSASSHHRSSHATGAGRFSVNQAFVSVSHSMSREQAPVQNSRGQSLLAGGVR